MTGWRRRVAGGLRRNSALLALAAVALLAGGALLFAQHSRTGTASLGVQVNPEDSLSISGPNLILIVRVPTGYGVRIWGDGTSSCSSPTGSLTENASGTYSIPLSTIPIGSSDDYICLKSTDSGAALSSSLSWPHTAASLKFSQQPSNAVAGVSISPALTVQVLDSNGALDTDSTAPVTIAIGTNPGGGTLSGTLTKSAVSGVATFSDLSIDKDGTGYTLTAASTGLTSAASNTFNITASAATKLAYTTVPSTGTAGTAFSVTVQSQDAEGNPASPTTNTTITLSKATGGGTLSGTLTGQILTSGNSVTISTPVYSKADTMTLTAAATLGETTLTPVTSGNIVFSAGTATQLVFTTQPGGGTGGTAWTGQPVVTVEDANGNTVTGSSASITLAIGTNPSGGTLTCTTNPGTASSGVATFAGCEINKAGNSYTLTANSTSPTLGPFTSSAFNITAGSAAKFAITGSGTQTAGASQTITITAQDAGGNTATSYTGSHSLTFSGADPSTNPVTHPTVTNSSGTATNFGAATSITFTSGVSSAGGVMKLYDAETATISVTDGSISSPGGLTVLVGATTANKLAWGVQPPSTITRGTATAVGTVLIEDQYGNLTNSGASVTLALNISGSDGIASGGTVSAVSGTATFGAVNLSGNQGGRSATFTASSGSLATATSNSFTVE